MILIVYGNEKNFRHFQVLPYMPQHECQKGFIYNIVFGDIFFFLKKIYGLTFLFVI